MEESLKDVYATHRGPLTPVVFREPDSGRRQPLPEVQGKGKKKVIEEQVVHSLLDLNTSKKKSTTDQYILQRRTPETVDPTGPSTLHEDEKATRADVETDTKELMTHTEKSGKEMSNTMVLEILTCSSLDLMDEGFTTTTYPNIQENLKLTVEEQNILEEPASSTGTLSSLQHITKDFSFGDQFFNDKPSEAKNKKTTAKTKVESMVSIIIQQDTSAIPPMTTPVSKAVDEIVTDAVDWAIQAPLQNRFRDFPEPDMKEILHQRMWETNSYQANEDHKNLYEALEKSMAPTSSFTTSRSIWNFRILMRIWIITSAASTSSTSIHQPRRNDRIPKVNLMQDWWKPLSEEDMPATPEPTWSIPSSDLPYQMEECHKLLTDKLDGVLIRYNVSKLLPLGGQPSQVTIQTDFFFNKDLEYLRYGSKGGRPALLISKIKAAYYHDVGLEQMVPDQMWIEEECKYDIAAMYGISHWWFQRQRFYIDKHTSEGDHKAVRTHMRILSVSVVKIEVLSLYGYDYMKNIILRRADLKEYIIAERDFKYLYPSDFEDLYLLNLQGHLNHLPPKDKKILTTAVSLWTRNLVIRQWVEDFQLGIESYQTQLNLTKP
nr:hypothetical protein [Tanacetum cinerariifolium]